MTEQELISKLRELKNVRPKDEWVVLAKATILNSQAVKAKESFRPLPHWNFSSIVGMFFQKKFAFALAILLFVFVGGIGFLGFNNQSKNGTMVELNNQEQVIAIKGEVEKFKVKSKTLSQIAAVNSTPADLSLAVKEVKEVAEGLTDAIKKDPQLAKEVALDINNNKTYLNIPGEDDLKETLDDLYEPIVVQLIEDFKHIDLTESQEKSVDRIEILADQKKFTSALEDALLLNIAIENN